MFNYFDLQAFNEAGENIDASTGDVVAPQDTGAELSSESGGEIAQPPKEPADAAQDSISKPYKVFASQEDYQQELQGVIGKRLGKYREMEGRMEKLTPALNTLMQYYDVKSEDELLKVIESTVSEEVAARRGISVDTLNQLNTLERTKAKLAQYERERQTAAFKNAVATECENLRHSDPEIYGEVNAEAIIASPAMLRLIAGGLSVKQAYDALNADAIIQRKAESAARNASSETQKAVLGNIQARQSRPAENALSDGTPADMSIDVSKLTDEQLEEYSRRARRGETITFRN